MVMHIIYWGIIFILLMIIGTLMDLLSEEAETNRRFYRNLRIDFDIRMKKLQKENEELRDQLGGFING